MLYIHHHGSPEASRVSLVRPHPSNCGVTVWRPVTFRLFQNVTKKNIQNSNPAIQGCLFFKAFSLKMCFNRLNATDIAFSPFNFATPKLALNTYVFDNSTIRLGSAPGRTTPPADTSIGIPRLVKLCRQNDEEMYVSLGYSSHINISTYELNT